MFEQLELNNPIIVPPVEEKIYNKAWITMLTICSESTDKASLYVKLIPCRDIDEYGNKELKQNITETDVTVMNIDNIFELLQTNTQMANAFNELLKAINQYGKEQNIFKNE
jgi:hypothetical protein